MLALTLLTEYGMGGNSLTRKLVINLLVFLLVFVCAIPKTTVVDASTQASPNTFEPVAVKGKTHGTTRIRVNFDENKDHLAIKISNTSISTPNKGDRAPTGGTVTNPYQPGTDISGVDSKINRYLGIYLLDDQNKVLTFKQIQLTENNIQPDKWEVVWKDNFDGQTIDESKWNFVQGGGGYGNHELQNYTNHPDNARVEDGHLVIQAKKEPFGTEQYTSAKLTTQGKGDWTYGRYEIRAKLPKGKGMWPAIWMMPSDYNLYTGWPASGEIDVMELLGDNPNKVYGTLHYGLPWKHTGTDYSLPNNQSFADDYHTFTLDWEPGEMRWYVDGVLYQKQNNWYSKEADAAAPFTYPAPFDRDFYLQLNLAVGGDWPGNPDITTLFPQQMDVDYVKVYQLDGTYREAVEPPASSGDSSDSNLRPPLTDGNYIYNGGFDNELANWQFQPFTPTDQFGGAGQVEFDNGAIKTTISQPGDAVYAVQLVQGGFPVEKGESYKLSFDAWSSGNRSMVTDISGPDQAFARYLQDQTVNLTSTSQHFEYSFKMVSNTDLNARVEFNMGGSSTLPVWIDNVRLEKLPKDPNAPRAVLPNGNYIYNGTFDEGPDRQLFWDFFTDTNAHAEATVGRAIPDRQLKVTFKNPGETVSSIRLSQGALNLEQGKSYVLTFDAYADAERTIDVNVINTDGHTKYAANQTFILDQIKKTYSFVFKMDKATDAHAVLQFLLGKDKQTTYIDNVKLMTVSPPQEINKFGRIEAENFQSMNGVQLADDKSSVGWIDEGDWMQYAVDVKEAGDYKVTYYVASGRDNGHIALYSKAGNIYNGQLPQGEIKDPDERLLTDIAQTGGWGTWKMVPVTETIHLDAGIQTFQVYAPNVNLDWIDLSLKELSDSTQLKISNWNQWLGDEWNGMSAGNMTVNNGRIDMQVTRVGNQSFTPQLFQEGLSFVTGQTYKVTFDASASATKSINVNIGKALANDPWFIPYVGTQKITLSTVMKTYSFTFIMSQPTYDNGKIVFEVGKIDLSDTTFDGHIYFDNIQIEPVSAP